MKTITLSLILKIILISTQTDFQLSLSYYSKPIPNMEWQISIKRTGKISFLQVENFRGITREKKISKRIYIELLNRLNSKGIWILKDYYRENSPNGYYLIEIKTENYSNSFKVEYGVPLAGGNSRYLEIIRAIINTAKLLLYE